MSQFIQEGEQKQELLEEVLALSDGVSLVGVAPSQSHSLQITVTKKNTSHMILLYTVQQPFSIVCICVHLCQEDAKTHNSSSGSYWSPWC